MGKLIEGFWDCPYCGTKHIGGLTKVCPNCLKQRDKHIKFYMDDPQNYISEEKAKTISKNPDWLCSFCDSLNSDDVDVCKVCGATKADSKLNYFQGLEKKEKLKNQLYQNTNSVNTEQQNTQDYSNNNQSENNFVSTSTAENRDTYEKLNKIKTAKPKKKLFSKFTKITAIALASILLITGLVFLFMPKTQEGVVDGFSWERSISIEELRTVDESDWTLPSGARLQYTQNEIRSYKQVIDHYETKTRTYTEEVLDHYEDYVSGHRDLGNGVFEEIISQRPVYRTETRTETYEEPVYRQEPIYDTKYYYEIDKWMHKDYVKTYGSDKEPYWGEYNYKTKEREGSKSENYKITIINSDNETKEYSVDFDVWKKLNKGESVKLKVYIGGKAELITE